MYIHRKHKAPNMLQCQTAVVKFAGARWTTLGFPLFHVKHFRLESFSRASSGFT